MTYCIKRLY